MGVHTSSLHVLCVPRGTLWEVLWEYGVPGSLLQAIGSLYNRCESYIHFLCSKSDLVSLGVGLYQG